MSVIEGSADMPFRLSHFCFDPEQTFSSREGCEKSGLASPSALLAKPTVSMSRSASSHSLGRGRIDYRAYPGDAVGRKAALLCMRPHRSLIGRDIDTIDLVISYKALDPLDLGAHPLQHAARLL